MPCGQFNGKGVLGQGLSVEDVEDIVMQEFRRDDGAVIRIVFQTKEQVADKPEVTDILLSDKNRHVAPGIIGHGDNIEEIFVFSQEYLQRLVFIRVKVRHLGLLPQTVVDAVPRRLVRPDGADKLFLKTRVHIFPDRARAFLVMRHDQHIEVGRNPLEEQLFRNLARGQSV